MNSDRLEQIKLNLRNNAINKRKMALDELATMSPDVALPILKQLAQDNDFTLRRLAVMGLGNHCTEESFQILKQLLEIEQDSNVLAEAATHGSLIFDEVRKMGFYSRKPIANKIP